MGNSGGAGQRADHAGARPGARREALSCKVQRGKGGGEADAALAAEAGKPGEACAARGGRGANGCGSGDACAAHNDQRGPATGVNMVGRTEAAGPAGAARTQDGQQCPALWIEQMAFDIVPLRVLHAVQTECH